VLTTHYEDYGMRSRPTNSGALPRRRRRNWRRIERKERREEWVKKRKWEIKH